MNFNEYQTLAKKTLVNNNEGQLLRLARLALGISGESGEVAEKMKKILRGDYPKDQYGRISREVVRELGKELGDILWYIAVLSDELGLNLEGIAEYNIWKLKQRQEEDKLRGSGDNR